MTENFIHRQLQSNGPGELLYNKSFISHVSSSFVLKYNYSFLFAVLAYYY
jgi:hypothetical protein